MEQLLQEMLQKNYGKSISDASNEEIYTALLCITKEKMAGMKRNEGNKKLYYISAEFLIGKLLSNNLINLGLFDETREVLKNHGKDITEIEGGRAGAVPWKRRPWPSGSMFPGFHRDTGTAGRRRGLKLPRRIVPSDLC